MVLTLVILAFLIVILALVRYKLRKIQVKTIRTLGELSQVNPLEFQYLTARIMRNKEWKNASVNDRLTADGGRDVMGYKEGQKWLGQCKRYAFNATIGVEEIRRLHGVCNSREYGPAKGLFIATCKFSQPAKEFARNNDILLWDLKTLIDLMT